MVASKSSRRARSSSDSFEANSRCSRSCTSASSRAVMAPPWPAAPAAALEIRGPGIQTGCHSGVGSNPCTHISARRSPLHGCADRLDTGVSCSCWHLAFVPLVRLPALEAPSMLGIQVRRPDPVEAQALGAGVSPTVSLAGVALFLGLWHDRNVL